MPKSDSQIQADKAKRDRELYEKSIKLRTYSSALLEESRELCLSCRKLRAINELIAINNVNPNAARKRKSIQALALRLASPSRYSIDVPFRSSAHKSNEFHLIVLDERKLLN